MEGTRVSHLFDLSRDPLELTNLADSTRHSEILKSLRTELKKWRSEYNDTRVVGDHFWENFDNEEILEPWKPGSHVHE